MEFDVENTTFRPLFMSPNILSFFGKKRQLKKYHFLRCPKRSLLDHQLLDNSFGQPHPVFFFRTFGQGRAVQEECGPLLLLT